MEVDFSFVQELLSGLARGLAWELGAEQRNEFEQSHREVTRTMKARIPKTKPFQSPHPGSTRQMKSRPFFDDSRSGVGPSTNVERSGKSAQERESELPSHFLLKGLTPRVGKPSPNASIGRINPYFRSEPVQPQKALGRQSAAQQGEPHATRTLQQLPAAAPCLGAGVVQMVKNDKGSGSKKPGKGGSSKKNDNEADASIEKISKKIKVEGRGFERIQAPEADVDDTPRPRKGATTNHVGASHGSFTQQLLDHLNFHSSKPVTTKPLSTKRKTAKRINLPTQKGNLNSFLRMIDSAPNPLIRIRDDDQRLAAPEFRPDNDNATFQGFDDLDPSHPTYDPGPTRSNRERRQALRARGYTRADLRLRGLYNDGSDSEEGTNLADNDGNANFPGFDDLDPSHPTYNPGPTRSNRERRQALRARGYTRADLRLRGLYNDGSDSEESTQFDNSECYNIPYNPSRLQHNLQPRPERIVPAFHGYDIRDFDLRESPETGGHFEIGGSDLGVRLLPREGTVDLEEGYEVPKGIFSYEDYDFSEVPNRIGFENASTLDELGTKEANPSSFLSPTRGMTPEKQTTSEYYQTAHPTPGIDTGGAGNLPLLNKFLQTLRHGDQQQQQRENVRTRPVVAHDVQGGSPETTVPENPTNSGYYNPAKDSHLLALLDNFNRFRNGQPRTILDQQEDRSRSEVDRTRDQGRLNGLDGQAEDLRTQPENLNRLPSAGNALLRAAEVHKSQVDMGALTTRAQEIQAQVAPKKSRGDQTVVAIAVFMDMETHQLVHYIAKNGNYQLKSTANDVRALHRAAEEHGYKVAPGQGGMADVQGSNHAERNIFAHVTTSGGRKLVLIAIASNIPACGACAESIRNFNDGRARLVPHYHERLDAEGRPLPLSGKEDKAQKFRKGFGDIRDYAKSKKKDDPSKDGGLSG